MDNRSMSLDINDTLHVQDNGTVQDNCESTTFFFIVYGPAHGLVCAFGLVGNALSIAVLHKYSRNSVATYLLKALAVMDNLFLASAVVVQMCPAMAMHFGQTERLQQIYSFMQTFAWPLVHMIQMGTVWMLVVVACNRYIAVCLPLKAGHLCTKGKVQVQIIVLAVTIFVYNVPRFLEFNYRDVNETLPDNSTMTVSKNFGLSSMQVYNIVYENVSYWLFVFLLPLTVLLFFNVHLVRDLKKAQQYRRVLKTSGRSVEENNITLVMIVIIVVFIVCQTPASINQILYYVVDDSQKKTCSPYIRFYHLANLLITINSSFNFVVYCLFRRQFQQELRALLCRHKKNGPPRRKTMLLRALHEHGSSGYLRTSHASCTQESMPLHENSQPPPQDDPPKMQQAAQSVHTTTIHEDHAS
ncbi:hypothetical protein CAPTEDRAFT_183437 [Capitella teleta]|uniref:G-protein coupled receptors family 1 profile domain-containing protein n=1 Tax=Capitella teleta TaxID=283909 RepID=R7VF61_CAPTE|nr:hypothetical protein CAPTEDRAFT_183437 [Capitella teleta]|eukprot:ELU14310.1 hypothetical protein CAPTEDRAFT_183437 [Capitella teleta]